MSSNISHLVNHFCIQVTVHPVCWPMSSQFLRGTVSAHDIRGVYNKPGCLLINKMCVCGRFCSLRDNMFSSLVPSSTLLVKDNSANTVNIFFKKQFYLKKIKYK